MLVGSLCLNLLFLSFGEKSSSVIACNCWYLVLKQCGWIQTMTKLVIELVLDSQRVLLLLAQNMVLHVEKLFYLCFF